MYQFQNQQLYHHHPYQSCPIVTADEIKLQNLNTISEAHYLQVLPQPEHHSAPLQVSNVIEKPPPEAPKSVNKKKVTSKKPKLRPVKENGSNKKTAKKPVVDTSVFSIEERLVAAVWVHERKTTCTTISQIKQNFRRRFGREPPSKTTFLVWERKLFATGNVCDAPRTGRPVDRKRHICAVAASVRSAPALSLRARARALHLPRSTLHSILRNDLPPSNSDMGAPTTNQTRVATDKATVKRRARPAPPRRSQPPSQPRSLAPVVPTPVPPAQYAPPHAPHMHYIMHTHPYTSNTSEVT